MCPYHRKAQILKSTFSLDGTTLLFRRQLFEAHMISHHRNNEFHCMYLFWKFETLKSMNFAQGINGYYPNNLCKCATATNEDRIEQAATWRLSPENRSTVCSRNLVLDFFLGRAGEMLNDSLLRPLRVSSSRL